MIKELLLTLVFFIYDKEYRTSWLYRHIMTQDKERKENCL